MTPSVLKIIPKGHYFIRARENSVAGKLYWKRNELKYPPIKRARLMRANFDNQPMFYVSYVADLTDIDDAIVTILYETSDVVRNLVDTGIEETTVSVWRAKKDLTVLVLPTFQIYPTVAEEFEYSNNLWEQGFEEYNTTRDEINYLKFIMENFSYQNKEDNIRQQEAYKVTAKFVNTVFANNPQLDGIMYPSARLKTERMGINIVFKTVICDKYLDLCKVYVAHFFKPNIEQEFLTYYMESIKCENHGKIKYKMCTDYLSDIKVQEAIQSPKVSYLKLKFNYQ